MTRVLVLTGVVTLVNAQGSITGQANHLLAAEAGKAPGQLRRGGQQRFRRRPLPAIGEGVPGQEPVLLAYWCPARWR